MPALAAGIHVLEPFRSQGVDGRNTPGDDEGEEAGLLKIESVSSFRGALPGSILPAVVMDSG
jgi:hypothetical protein